MSVFTKFNHKQTFTIDKESFVNPKAALTPDEVYALVGKQECYCKLLGAWRFDFKEEKAGLPDHKYSLGIEINSENYYVNCPPYMVKDFDAIVEDAACIREINAGRCEITPYEYTNSKGTFIGFKFK